MEIDQAILEAQQNAAEDAKNKEGATIKDRTEQLIYQSSAILKKLDKDDREKLNDCIKHTKKSLKSKDTTLISAAYNELSEVLENMQEKIPHDDSSDTGSNNQENNSSHSDFESKDNEN